MFIRGLLVLTILFFSTIAFADEIIEGRYCYTYGDNESIKEARELTKTLAVRNAIETYRIFAISTSSVKDFVLTNDIVQIVSSGYMANIKVLEHSEEGRTICEKIRATVSPKAIENVIRNVVKKRTDALEERGIDNNGYLKILNIEKTKNEYGYPFLSVVVKVLKNTGGLFLPRERNNALYFKICVDYFDSTGNPVGGDARFIHDNSSGMVAGEVKAVQFSIPSNVNSYKAWLPEAK